MSKESTEKDLITRTVRLSKIKISDEFTNTLPRTDKFTEKYDYYKKRTKTNKKYGCNYNVFQSPIIVDKHYVLIDGYIT